MGISIWRLLLIAAIAMVTLRPATAQETPQTSAAAIDRSESSRSQTSRNTQSEISPNKATDSQDSQDRHNLLPVESSIRLLADASQSISDRQNVQKSLQTGVIFVLLALVPIGLLMTTGYVRLAVVLGLLRQGFGATSVPPPQVITALALFLTALVMTPVWMRVKQDAVDPYFAADNPISLEQALQTRNGSDQTIHESANHCGGQHARRVDVF